MTSKAGVCAACKTSATPAHFHTASHLDRVAQLERNNRPGPEQLTLDGRLFVVIEGKKDAGRHKAGVRQASRTH